MIIKLAWQSGGLVDQSIAAGPLNAVYALGTDKNKSMHHGKATAIGAGIGSGIVGSIGAYGVNTLDHMEHGSLKHLQKQLLNKDISRKMKKHLKNEIKNFKGMPLSHKAGIVGALAGIGALYGGALGIIQNAQIRTLRAANRGLTNE